MASLARALRREDDGFVMIVAVVLLTAMATLAALVMATGTHANKATGRGRNWAQALHVAEAGMEDAIVLLQASNGAIVPPVWGAPADGVTGTASGSTADGTYEITVTRQSRNRYLVDATGSVATGSGLGLAVGRKLRVTMAPPQSFRYALFSNTSVDTKNNDHVIGDIWANTNIFVDMLDVVEGDMTAATGWVQLDGGSQVTGDVWAGGYNPDDFNRAIHLGGGATIGGFAKGSVSGPASQADCNGEDNTKYKIHLDSLSSIAGNVTTWGPITGPGTIPPGQSYPNTCTAAAATKTIPEFTYFAGNYDAATLHEYGTAATPSPTALVDFKAYLDANSQTFSGTFYINQSGAVNQDNRIDLTGVKITGDTTIISNAPIFTNGNTDSGTDNIVVLNSTYQPPVGSTCDVNQDKSECAIHVKNNFQVSGTTCNTAVLIYAKFGPVAIKNNETQCGSVYSDNIQIKNNQTLVYDARIERVVGFGDFTLDIANWIECPPGGC